MKRLPPDRRNKLIMVIVATVVVTGLIYFYLISPQSVQNLALAAQTNKELTRLQQMKKLIRQADATASTAVQIGTLLDNAEADTASGDVFAWTYDTIREFKASHHVEIINMGQPIETDEERLLPNFPYRQIKFQIVGSGFYHDIGKFLADLENKFPHIRLLNLTIDPFAANDPASEKLSFRVEVAALVKPNSSNQ